MLLNKLTMLLENVLHCPQSDSPGRGRDTKLMMTLGALYTYGPVRSQGISNHFGCLG